MVILRHYLSDERRNLLMRVLNGALGLASVGSLALFVLLIGWPLTDEQGYWVHLITRALLGVFVAQEIVRVLVHPHPFEHMRRRKVEMALAFLILCEFALGGLVNRWVSAWMSGIQPDEAALLVLACSQLTLIALVMLRGLRRVPLLAARNLSPGGALIMSFAVFIIIGTLLLKMPRATPAGISWTDALFTATSAVCVTGLTVLDTARDFTTHGQFILLGLVQVGGLGIMSLTYFFVHFLTSGGVSFRNRIALQDLLSEENLGQIGMVLGIIVGFTFSFEAAGALAIYFSLDIPPELTTAAAGGGAIVNNRVFFAVFHSVMAFCNAGFSSVPDGLANPALRGQAWMICVIMLLVTAGGIGFSVVKNFWQVVAAMVRRMVGLRVAVPPRLTINSRVVLVTSLVLTLGGGLVVYLTEFVFSNGDTGGLPGPLAALFYSVTSRSCGFNISNVQMFVPATTVTIMFLMFVGGSPGSTAGGVKTSTLAVAVLALRRVLWGRPEIEAFGRRVSDEVANRALSVMVLAGAFLTLVVVALCILHPELPVTEVAFEAISASSTTGLSRGVSPVLGDAAKCVMVGAMFVGRIGVLMIMLAIIPRKPQKGYRLPEGGIVIT